jgi:O-antigen/teichoic acid export membrane protein
MSDNDHLNESLRTIAKGAGIGFAGAMFGTVIGYLSRMVIARYLGPEDYGLISLGFAAMMIATVLSLMGLNSGVQRYVAYYRGKGDEGRIKGTIISALKITVPMSLLFMGVVFFGADWIAIHVFHEKEFTPVLMIFAIGIPFWTITTVFVSVSIAFQQIKYHVYTMYLFKDSVKLIAIVCFLVAGYGVIGAAIGWILAVVGMSVLSFYFLEKKAFPIFSGAVKSISMDKELYYFSFPLIFVGILSMVTGWTDTFMLGYLCTSTEVGIYNAALPTSKLLGVVLSPIGMIFGPVIVGLYANDRIDDLRRTYSSVTKWIFSLVFPGFLLMVLFSERILIILFGDAYVSGSIALGILAFGVLITAMVGPASLVITAYGRTKIIMWCSFFGALVNVGLNLFLIPVYGINGAAVATGFSLALITVLHLVFAYRIGGVQPFGWSYVKPLFASIVAVAVVYVVVQYVIGVSAISLVVMLFVFGLLYFILLLLMKGFDEEDLVVMRAIDQRLGTKSDWARGMIRRFL